MAKIVIVEDEGIVALDIKRHLENYGYTVPAIFAAGEDALEHLSEKPSDLVLMDISLQGKMDGLDTADILRNKYRIPVILLTAYADDKTIERAKSSAPFGYIIKPFEARELRTTIEMALHRAELERKLHESEERYHRFFQEDVSADFVCDAQGFVLDCNAAYIDLYAFSDLQEAKQVNINTLFRDREEQQRFWESAEQEKKEDFSEFSMKRYDGKGLRVRANIVPRFSSQNELQEVNAFIFDTTRLRELEDQLRQAQKMEAVGRLAGGVAHDFNNILTVIMGYATMLDDKVKSGEEIGSDIHGIQKAAQKATVLTRQLLAFSRRQVLKPKQIDLNELVLGMEKMMQRLLSEDVAISLIPRAEHSLVYVDPGQWEQVLMNLVVNARDAMPGGGKIIVSTAYTRLEEVATSYMGKAPVGEYVVLEVQDTGSGISEADLELVFEPFFTTKPDEKGTGLGLSTVYGIVQQSSGHIFVKTGEGGTTFSMYIPLSSRKSSAALEKQREDKQLTGGDETILLVEDEEGVLTLMDRILSSAGYRVLSARNGGEALLIQEQQKERFDLLISDIIMPHLNGKELFQRLSGVQENLPVLYISGYPERTIQERGITSGEDPFLRKPFEPAQLLKKVRELLDKEKVSG